MEENPSTFAKPVRKRHWFHYALRVLLVLTAVVAVWFAWWSFQARQQREAVAALRKVRASIQYDFQFDDKNVNVRHPPYWPVWMVDNLGVDYFANVAFVGDVSDLTEADAKYLESLSAIKAIGFIRPNVTDAWLEDVKGLGTLEFFSLSHALVTDAGLEKLRGLAALRVLNLTATQVTPAGVERLQKALPNCKITGP